jgi:mono/diheme cytochrome c family protein
MTRKAWFVVMLLAAALRVADAQGAALDATQRHGRAIFLQDCAVCHTKPNAGVYAPALGAGSLNGQSDMLRDVISDGTPRMPGFKHELNRGDIEAIVAFIKTVPMPPGAAPTPAAPAPRTREEPEGDR